jgi:hypothetical protein
MKGIEQVQEIIDKVNQRETKEYHRMEIEEISDELRSVMRLEQESFQKIDELEKNGVSPEVAKYAKMVCRNTTEREISEIQKTYLEKIDREYLNK